MTMALYGLLLVSAATVGTALSAGTSSYADSVATDTTAMIYLSQYGYLSPSVKNPAMSHLMSEESVSKAISEFQSFVGLNITGNLDTETLKMMSIPRCGVKDKVGVASDLRSKRYALQGSRWRVKNLTYKISKYPSRLRKRDVDEEIRQAFSLWSDYTDLTFTPKQSGSVHIEIRFERGEHGDGDPFDGPGGTLAHAYFPVYGGDAHFDDSERWTINSFSGTNLKQVAAHEFGHSLGLSHSDVRAALMAPFYRGYDPSLSLDEDDIEGIQALYGRKSRNTDSDSDSAGTSNRHSTTEAPTEEDAELCTSASVDTIFNSADGSTFAFKGQHFWKLTEESIAPGYPQRISKSWPGLPGDIDAAFTYKNGKTYFFKGSQYWRYTGRKMDGNYPKPISEGFTGIPDNLDAAFVWSGNGKIYFFKRDKFWRFDPSSRPPVKNTYPKPIANWEGLPNDLDAALQYTNGFTYFFKGGQYYRFNDRAFAVDVANPPFPRPAGYWWFGCRSATKGSALGNLQSEQKEVRDKVLSALIVADPKAPLADGEVSGAAAQGSAEEYHRDEAENDHVDDLILDAGR
ncbi:stromelysin-3 isoform X2 [Frankliniella occidentalis]|uniref:Stromelysin-3 isoform X2 n=1 Tax=Frankliniella occidentalis TaxID=133901 RepID=A0A9C6TX53_FRAOC|nr:stromelysin-3 isoform X2 [Frankliniella occidentalis]